MLVIRALANLTKTEAGRKSLAGDRLSEVSRAQTSSDHRRRADGSFLIVQLLEHLAGRHTFTTFNKNTRVAFATLALKWVSLLQYLGRPF